MIKGVDQHRARTFSELGGEAKWCLDGRSLEDDVSPVTAGRQELRDRHTEGHEDRRGDAELVSRQRDALCVIARRSGDDSTRTLRLREAGEPVGRAANLERAGPLQVLEFESDGNTEQVGQMQGLVHRGAADDSRQSRCSILDVGEGGDTHLPILLGRGTVDQIRSGASGVAPVSHALSPR